MLYKTKSIGNNVAIWKVTLHYFSLNNIKILVGMFSISILENSNNCHRNFTKFLIFFIIHKKNNNK